MALCSPTRVTFALLLLASCDCPCDPATVFRLAPVTAAPPISVSAAFSRPQGAAPTVTCNWASDEWQCSPDDEEFHFEDLKNPWFVRLTGPAGTIELERQPRDTAPSEGFPSTECPPCFPFEVAVESSHLREVGATTSPLPL